MKDYVTLNEIELEKIQLYMDQMFSPTELQGMDFSISEETITRNLLFNVRKTFFGEKKHVSTMVSFEFPKTWWDHFKMVNFPKWILKKYPVKYETRRKEVYFDRYFEFPEAYRQGHQILGKIKILDTELKFRDIQNERL